MIDANQLDLSSAPEYRKKALVLAFANRGEGLTVDKEARWGSNQKLRGDHFIICGTLEPYDGPGGYLLHPDCYGCAGEEFEAMYEPFGVSNFYRKTQTIRAVCLDAPFTLTTRLADGTVEVETETGEPGDWVVLQPKGERQIIKHERFEQIYEPVTG